MRAMRSVSVVPLFRITTTAATVDSLIAATLVKSAGLSIRSAITTTLSKTRVFIRILFGRQSTSAGSSQTSANGWQTTLSSEFKTRIVSDGRHRLLAADSATSSPTKFNKWLNRLLSDGHKLFVNRLNANQQILPKAIVIRNTGLTLGLVGVCVKTNDHNQQPSLTTETDVIESNCQEIRNIFLSCRQFVAGKHCRQLDSLPDDLSLNNIEFGSCIAKGCNGVVYSAKLKNIGEDNVNEESVAVKMLFNFEAESNATDIWKALHKECLPFSGDLKILSADNINCLPISGDEKRRTKLGPHPNIVDILGVFVDKTPQLGDALQLYPDALPARMGGYGRNMTLFIVEKQYQMSLKQYLSSAAGTVSTNTANLLLVQLLEAVSYLTKCHVAHRDLKTDNILLSFDDQIGGNDHCPWLVVTDFGFSLTSLSLPFPSDELCRGGNRALMAPEIIGARSGPTARLDYRRSDLWSVGAIAYELYNGRNPFYPYPEAPDCCLYSQSYTDSQLPEPPSDMPPLIQSLVVSFLSRNPNKRTPVITAVNVCHILQLMKPTTLLHKLLTTTTATHESGIKRNKLIYRWLKTLSMNTIANRLTIDGSGDDDDDNRQPLLSAIEFKLRVLFLSQVKIEHMNSALDYIADNTFP
ncbi:serine/threonine-protein kinase Pink1, mitochondrial-like [Oppia nitens]|uniref:serine/threonine-protein kinase Pink1, mitochondrial-like n=1 Tax=Oppia nitens TaxID=1686743 RepID=UPI0023DABD49|nr:serine/threonine-protein kinase Pink1, mitochondrial-like [Oppia nitens]